MERNETYTLVGTMTLIITTLSISGAHYSNDLPLFWVSRLIYCYAECRYDECHYAECRYVECGYDECRYAECRYAECRYTECCGAHLLMDCVQVEML